MKVALLADIHGNDLALAAVLKAAAESRATMLLIAGDFVGYYYRAESVLNLLSGWDWTGVRGNHEDMLRSWADGTGREAIKARYGSGLEAAHQELSREAFDLLTRLPTTRELTIAERRILICHGTPWDHVAYVYPDTSRETRERFADGAQDLVLFGHSHYPVVWRQGATLVVNPGSVGQPRDGVPGACWALWDTDHQSVTLRREHYDARPLMDQCRQRDPLLPYLADVLVRRADTQ